MGRFICYPAFCLVFCLFLDSNMANLLGAPEDANVDDKDVMEAADFAVAELNKMSNWMYLNKLDHVIKAQKQLVNGYNYILTIKTAPTTCRNNEENLAAIEKCPINTSKTAPKPFICKVAVHVEFPVNVEEDRPGKTFMQPPSCFHASEYQGNVKWEV